jgi:putative addiction module component (TIGR02574 family)
MSMVTPVLSDILQLSIPERIQLVEDIWDTIAATPEQLALSEAQKDELDRRIEMYRQDTEAGISWQELKDKIQSHP